MPSVYLSNSNIKTILLALELATQSEAALMDAYGVDPSIKKEEIKLIEDLTAQTVASEVFKNFEEFEKLQMKLNRIREK